MLSPRWRKVVQDLVANKTRTVLVVLSIAVGVFAVGMIAGTEVVLSRDLDSNYMQANPSAAIIYTDDFDDEFAASMRHVPGVAWAQGSRGLSVRATLRPNDVRTLSLMSTPDHGMPRINEIWPEKGAWPPPAKEIVLERASLAFFGLKIGDTITVEDANQKVRTLRIAGTAHFINLPPPQFAGAGYGFASLDTLEWLGTSRSYSELQLEMASEPLNKQHIEQVAADVRERVEGSGRRVYYTYLPDPGKYPASDGIQVILLLLGVLGGLSLLLSGFLVVNTVSALVTQQIRQIGVMKAVGARRSQIVGMYLSTILGYGLLALLVGIPLGTLGAYVFSGIFASICNFDVRTYAPPLHVLGMEVAVGLAVPVLAALWPVFGGTRISVREALSSEGIGATGGGTGLINRIVGRVRGASRPLLISLRNTFRRKGRLALTLSTLTLGGAIFIAVVSVRESTVLTLNDALQYFNYDVEVSLNRSHRAEQVLSIPAQVPGVVKADILGGESVRRIRPNGAESNNVFLLALPADTPLVKPQMVSGRWLLPDDENALVLNTTLLKDEPDVKVGSEVVYKLGGKETNWKVVGITRGVMTGPIAYANRPYFWRVAEGGGRGGTIWVLGSKHDAASEQELAKALEAAYKAEGIKVRQTQTIEFIRSMVQSQFDLIVIFLMVMAVLLAVVGGLGLMGTMSLNVIERTREIGVMRAVGASNGAIRQVFIVEGVLIGLLSWLVGAALSLPISKALSDGIGLAFLQTPLSHKFSETGLVIWLVLVVIIATLASVLPARSASRLSVREVLAYE